MSVGEMMVSILGEHMQERSLRLWRTLRDEPQTVKCNAVARAASEQQCVRYRFERRMPIPDYQSLMLPILRIMADRTEHAVSQMRQQIADDLKLTEAELAERLASGTTTFFMNRIGWAVQYLKSAGAIRGVRRGVYEITDRGIALLGTKPSEITVRTLRQFPEFVEFVGKGSDAERATVPALPQIETKATPEESLESSFKALRDALALELLETIKNGTPAAFERIVVDLLLAMGYGGSGEDAGTVVGKSGDGGIDGIIKQDKLGLDAIYVQAKRWQNVVGSPDIMKFSGGLTKRHANRGVFITTSTFTKDALEFVEALPQKIVLVDGKRLAFLMIEPELCAQGCWPAIRPVRPPVTSTAAGSPMFA
jgi:restriction system protein